MSRADRSTKLLVRPLRSHLVGLKNKINPFDTDKTTQSILECSDYLLTELERIDAGGDRL